MTTINDLSAIDRVSNGDQLPTFSVHAGTARRMSVSQLLAFFRVNFTSPDFDTIISSPISGFNQVLSSAQSIWLLLTPSGTLATGTVTLPPVDDCADGQEVLVTSLQQVTALTVAGNGATVNGAPTTIDVNGAFRLRFSKLLSSWFIVSGAVASSGGSGIDQLTGDVTAGPGSGSQVATIANSAVSLAKMADIASDRLLGRHDAGTGAVQEVTVGGGLDLASGALRRQALTGDVTANAGSNTTAITDLPLSKLADVTGPTVLGRVTGTGVVGALTAAEARGIIQPPLAASDWWAGGYVGGHTAVSSAVINFLVGAGVASGTVVRTSENAPGRPAFALTASCHASNANSGFGWNSADMPWRAGVGMRILVRLKGTTTRTWTGWSNTTPSGVLFFFTGLDVVARVGTSETLTTYTLNTDEWFWFEFDGLADNSGATFRVRRAVDGVVVWTETKTGTMPAVGNTNLWRNNGIYPVNPGGVTEALQFGAWFIGTPNGLRHVTGRP